MHEKVSRCLGHIRSSMRKFAVDAISCAQTEINSEEM